MPTIGSLEMHGARFWLLDDNCAEFDLRYNTRDMTEGERAAEIFKGGIGRRITYRRTGKVAA